MKKFLMWLLSLSVAFGLAFGQSDDGAGSAGDQETPAVEQPVGPDQPADDATGDDGDDAVDGADGANGAVDDAADGADGADGATDDAVDGADGADGAADGAEGADDTVDGADDSAADPAQPGDDAVDGDDAADDTTTDPAMPGDDTTQPETDPATDPATEPADTADTASTAQGFVDALRASPNFSMFADALERSNLSDSITQDGQFTILAPTNQAFEQAGISFEQLDQQQLTELVRNHIISGFVSADQLGNLAGVVTLLGNEYAINTMAEDTVAGGQADGEVAGGGQAEPAEPVEPTQPDGADQEEAGQDAADQADGAADTDDDTVMDGAADVPAMPGEEALAGQMDAEGLGVGEGALTADRIEVEGGVIYGIDTVLVPTGFDSGAQDVEAPDTTPAAPGQDDAEGGETDTTTEPVTPAVPDTTDETQTVPGDDTQEMPTVPDTTDETDGVDGADGAGETDTGDTTDFGADEDAQDADTQDDFGTDDQTDDGGMQDDTQDDVGNDTDTGADDATQDTGDGDAAQDTGDGNDATTDETDGAGNGTDAP